MGEVPPHEPVEPNPRQNDNSATCCHFEARCTHRQMEDNELFHEALSLSIRGVK